MIDTKISELRLNLGENGELVISSEILQGMGLLPLDSVYMAYLTKDGLKNEYQEFLLTPRSLENLGEDQKIMIPSALLEQANISLGEDIQILCLNGAILLCEDSVLNKQDLELLLQQLQSTSDIISSLPDHANSAIQQLEQLIQEGASDNGADES